MERKIFISHSSADSDWARSFAQALERRGLSVWFDESELQAGDSWRDALEDGLRSSDVIVALLDAESSSNPNLFFELGAAVGMGKPVVSIVPKGSNVTRDIRLRRYLIRDTPEQTAEEFSQTLQAA